MRVYLSHAIRGKAGVNATAEEKNANCQKAIQFATVARMNMQHRASSGRCGVFLDDNQGLFVHPGDEIYVPAEHEDFVSLTYDLGYLTEKQILEIDCLILKECDALLAFGPVSRGMKVEIDYANEHGIPVFYKE